MTLVMTVLVRDEADIIVPMIEYHLAAGVDRIIVTDNGSIDGTRQILARYAADERVVVEDDPVQDKNQSKKVTRMARRAATEFGADWVINADADEFFVPLDRSMNLREVFARMPVEIVSAVIPVIDMTGEPTVDGAGIEALVFRDERVEEGLYQRSGLHAHATHDAIHVGSADVTVAQGNHHVSLASQGPVPPELSIESLHFPWRSYRQFEKKVVNAGRAYEASPHLRPSPRHHGMRDYRLWRAGVLEAAYIFRHPPASELGAAELLKDEWLHERLLSIARTGAATCPDLLDRALARVGARYDAASLEHSRDIMQPVLAIDEERTALAVRAAASAQAETAVRSQLEVAQRRIAELEQETVELADELTRVSAELTRIEEHPAFRVSRATLRWARSMSPANIIGHVRRK
ncbi:glycosyltransferase family 2 protein [Microbacterium sp. bgisy203]|uniref:glycosyltransferase family 2 protein n=1 Tax=Microbacterium sp. bgisy203 TaxID=3413799 RepID=UPI003D714711